MSSPRSDATSTSNVCHFSVARITHGISQRLSEDEDFRVVVQHLNEYITTNDSSFEEYKQALREL